MSRAWSMKDLALRIVFAISAAVVMLTAATANDRFLCVGDAQTSYDWGTRTWTGPPPADGTARFVIERRPDQPGDRGRSTLRPIGTDQAWPCEEDDAPFSVICRQGFSGPTVSFSSDELRYYSISNGRIRSFLAVEAGRCSRIDR